MSTWPRGGVVPPMITPLRPDHTVDTAAVTRLVRAHAAAGTSGVLVLGSTGEGPNLSFEDSEAVVGAAVDSHHPVMANAVGATTRECASRARRWKAAGAAAIMAPPPLGFELSPSELARHFTEVAEAAGEPILAYHVPSRIPSAATPQLMGELVRRGVLMGLKDSSGDLDNHRHTAMVTAGTGALLYTGTETTVDLAIQTGFTGTIPGLSNLYPHAEVVLLQAALAQHWEEARRLQEAILPFMDIYFGPRGTTGFVATVIGGVKTALVQAGLIEHATMSSPLGDPSQELQEYVANHLRKYPADIVGVMEGV